MLNKGYIARGMEYADKRAKPPSLTDESVRVFNLASPVLRARQDRTRSALSEKERAQFDHLPLKMVFSMLNWVTPEQH